MKTISLICAAAAACAFGIPAHATYYHFEFGYQLNEEPCDTNGNCWFNNFKITGQINTDDDGNGVWYFDPTAGWMIFGTWPYAFPGDSNFSYDPAKLGAANARLPGTGYVNDDCGPRCVVLSSNLYYLAGYKSDVPTGPIGVTLGTDFSPAIPEPESWAMMVGGFGLIGAAMRGRRRTTVRFA